MSIEIDPKKILQFLLLVSTTLSGVSLLSFFTFYTAILDVGQDSSIPTWYSSVNLLACSILLAIISLAKRGDRYFCYWMGLSGITLFMSIDEVAKIHERVGGSFEIVLNSLGLSIKQGFFTIPGLLLLSAWLVSLGCCI